MPQVNIENLTKLAQERNDETAWRSLWGGVFSLPAWFAVSDAKRPDLPMVLIIREQPTLPVFTDEAKARQFIKKGPAQGASSTIRLQLPQVLSFMHMLSGRGVTQVIFNVSMDNGPRAFGYGLAGLVQLASAYGVVDPNIAQSPPPVPTGDTQLDGLVAQMAADPSEAKSRALFGYVYALPEWHVLVRGEGEAAKPAITVLNEKPVVLAFTSDSLAQAQAAARNITTAPTGAPTATAGEQPAGAPSNSGPVSVRSMPVERAIELVEGTMGLHGVVFNDGSQPFFSPMRHLRPMLDAFRQPPPSDSGDAAAPDPQ